MLNIKEGNTVSNQNNQSAQFSIKIRALLYSPDLCQLSEWFSFSFTNGFNKRNKLFLNSFSCYVAFSCARRGLVTLGRGLWMYLVTSTFIVLRNEEPLRISVCCRWRWRPPGACGTTGLFLVPSALRMLTLHFSRVNFIFCKVGKNPVALGNPTSCRNYKIAAVPQHPMLLKMCFLG